MTVSAEDQESIGMLMEHISDHLQDDENMDQLSNLVHMSKSKLKYTFKAISNMTVAEYVAIQRRSKACELLSGSDLSVEEIGRSVGFNSTSSFSRFFKDQTNLTPSAYRRHSRV